MSLFNNEIRIGAAGVSTGYEVERSLRFNHPDNAYLTYIPSSDGNRQKWTWSGWVKRVRLGSTTYGLFTSQNDGDGGGNNGIASIYFGGDDRIHVYYDTTGSNHSGAINDSIYRDPSAWYHIVWQVDAANSTSKIFVNGVSQTVNVQPVSGYNYTMNQSGKRMTYGIDAWDLGSPASIYIAECHYSDGQLYDADVFAETDPKTGQWVPKESPAITYGTNGHYLNFSDNSNNTATTIGKDYSGQGNNFTPTNISVSAGTGNDSLEDTPTNNFPVFNRLNAIKYNNNYNTILEQGNLLMRGGDNIAPTTFLFPKSGKWYLEVQKYGNGAAQGVSIVRADSRIEDLDGNIKDEDIIQFVSGGHAYARNSDVGVFTSWENNASVVIGIAVDMDNGAVYFAVNNTWQNSGDPTSGASKTGAIGTDLLTVNNGNHYFAAQGFNGSDSYGLYVNFGQRAFSYSAPTGYEKLCSKNMPDPAILLPNEHFNTLLYSGTGNTTQNITGVGFAPDWVWIKNRSQSTSHYVLDTVRGLKDLHTNSTATEGNSAGRFNSFDSDGFQVEHSGGGGGFTNGSGQNYVAWNWNAGNSDGKTYTVKVVSDGGNKYRFDDFGTSAVTLDLAEGGTYIFDQSDSSNSNHPLRFSTTSNGTHGGGSEYTTGVTTSGSPGSSGAFTKIVVAASAPTLYYYCTNHSGMGGQANTNSTLGSSNFDGNNQSTVKANPSAGFSIVNYVGTGQNSTDVTMGHGLGVTPAMVIIKKRDSGGSEAQWGVLHQKLSSGKNIFLQTYGGEGTYSNYIKSMQSSTFTVNTASASAGRYNRSGNNYISYVFAEVEGFSKFGSYIGNGNSNGRFIYLGFRPAFFLLKAKTTDISWYMYDSKRDPDNLVDKELNPHNDQSEASGHDLDFVSNGVKMRSSDSSFNYNNYEYIYWAFAESPFKYSRAR